jgi:hypothetical protein
MEASCRRRRIADFPPGYVQELLPLYRKLAVPVATSARSEQVFDHLAEELDAQFSSLARLRARYTVSHALLAKRLLEQVQEVAFAQMALREQQPMLDRLRRLARQCQEALVTVCGVCGLAETGLLLRDPMKTYWHFGNALLELRRSCQVLAREMAKGDSVYQSCSVSSMLSSA